MDRRRFLASTAGMAAAFLAMNEVFGPLFDVSRAEAQTPGVADRRAGALAGQFIFDDQVHFVRDDFNQAGLLDLAKYASSTGTPSWPARTTSPATSSRISSRRSTSTATPRWRCSPERRSMTRAGIS